MRVCLLFSIILKFSKYKNLVIFLIQVKIKLYLIWIMKDPLYLLKFYLNPNLSIEKLFFNYSFVIWKFTDSLFYKEYFISNN